MDFHKCSLSIRDVVNLSWEVKEGIVMYICCIGNFVIGAKLMDLAGRAIVVSSRYTLATPATIGHRLQTNKNQIMLRWR